MVPAINVAVRTAVPLFALRHIHDDICSQLPTYYMWLPWAAAPRRLVGLRTRRWRALAAARACARVARWWRAAYACDLRALERLALAVAFLIFFMDAQPPVGVKTAARRTTAQNKNCA